MQENRLDDKPGGKMTRSRILASVFTCCPPGKPGFTGGEDILGWNLIQEIAKSNEVWAITHAEDRSSIEESLAEVPCSNIHFYYMGLPRFLKPLLRIQGGHQFYYYLWQIKAFFVSRRLHRQVRFDLFHHITYANDWMSSFIGALLPVPYIRGPGGGAHRTPKKLQKEYTPFGRIWEKVRTGGQWVLRHDPFFIKGQQRASAILLCNQDSISIIPEKWSHKVHLFPVSGVSCEDLALEAPAKTGHDRFTVFSAGSLIRIKGFGLAIKAFKLFSDRYPDSDFTIAGSGPEERHLRSLINQLGLNDKVHLAGAIPRDDVMRSIASCSVVLFPSLRDGGGTVVIEAMSSGKAVICLDIAGPGLHITEECGIKVAPADPEVTMARLADAVERLYLDEDLRKKMGEAARERADQNYRWDRLGERLMEIYRPFLRNEDLERDRE